MNYQFQFDRKWKRLHLYDFMILYEFQQQFNGSFVEANHIGIEFNILEILSLRTGFFEEKFGWNGNPSFFYDKTFTYGFGIKLPLNLIADIPLQLTFDYAKPKTERAIIRNWIQSSSYQVGLKFLILTSS